MEPSPDLRKMLRDALESQDATALKSFDDPKAWSSLPSGERWDLARLFVDLGGRQLKKRDGRAFYSFGLARQLAPENAELMALQGDLCLQFRDESHALTAADRAYQRAIELEPARGAYWLGYGRAHLALGQFYQDQAQIASGERALEKAVSLLDTSDPKWAKAMWEWGRSWLLLGGHSGEAMDFHMAVAKFTEVEALDLQQSHFWTDFGVALMELANLIARHELFEEATKKFQRALEIEPSFFYARFQLALAWKHLYELVGDDRYFEEAQEEFGALVQSGRGPGDYFLEWGQLYAVGGKLKQDPDLLEAAIEKFETASTERSRDPLLLKSWAEAELVLGAWYESLDLLRLSEQRILASLEISHDDPHSWYIYGGCLAELGRYFQDSQYFRQAIGRFHHGLGLREDYPLLLYGLAMAQLTLGEMEQDVEAVEQAHECCLKVMEKESMNMPQFWHDWGVILCRLGEMRQSGEKLEQAVDAHERSFAMIGDDAEIPPDWLYDYGCALDFFGDYTDDERCYERAVKVLQRVLREDPRHPHAGYNLALAYCHLGEVTGEMDYFYQSLAIFDKLAGEDSEDDLLFNDWATTLIHLTILLQDPDSVQEMEEVMAEAESKLHHAVSLGSTLAYYNLACLNSLGGDYQAALYYLGKAREAGSLPPADDLVNDEWLHGLRETTGFQNFLSSLQE